MAKTKTESKGYTPKPTPLEFERNAGALAHWMTEHAEVGGWNPKTRKMVPMPMRESEGYSLEGLVNIALDSIAAAVEAGEIADEDFPQNVFASAEAYQQFRDGLLDHNECYWVTDRWFTAFLTIGLDEYSARNFDSLSENLADFRWTEKEDAAAPAIA